MPFFSSRPTSGPTLSSVSHTCTSLSLHGHHSPPYSEFYPCNMSLTLDSALWVTPWSPCLSKWRKEVGLGSKDPHLPSVTAILNLSGSQTWQKHNLCMHSASRVQGRLHRV